MLKLHPLYISGIHIALSSKATVTTTHIKNISREKRGNKREDKRKFSGSKWEINGQFLNVKNTQLADKQHDAFCSLPTKNFPVIFCASLPIYTHSSPWLWLPLVPIPPPRKIIPYAPPTTSPAPKKCPPPTATIKTIAGAGPALLTASASRSTSAISAASPAIALSSLPITKLAPLKPPATAARQMPAYNGTAPLPPSLKTEKSPPKPTTITMIARKYFTATTPASIYHKSPLPRHPAKPPWQSVPLSTPQSSGSPIIPHIPSSLPPPASTISLSPSPSPFTPVKPSNAPNSYSPSNSMIPLKHSISRSPRSSPAKTNKSSSSSPPKIASRKTHLKKPVVIIMKSGESYNPSASCRHAVSAPVAPPPLSAASIARPLSPAAARSTSPPHPGTTYSVPPPIS